MDAEVRVDVLTAMRFHLCSDADLCLCVMMPMLFGCIDVTLAVIIVHVQWQSSIQLITFP